MQVKLAKKEIEELHPIKKTPLDVSFPVIFWPWGALKRCCKDDAKEEQEADNKVAFLAGFGDKFADANDPNVKKRLAAKAERERKKAEAAKLAKRDFSTDPIGAYGFGLIAYRGTLGALVGFFFCMSFLLSPVIYDYEHSHAINTNITQTPYGMFSIANLGYSSVQCRSVGLNMKTIVMTCPYGKIAGISDFEWNDPQNPQPENNAGPAFGLNPAKIIGEDEVKYDNTFKDACRRQTSFPDEYGEYQPKFSNKECSEELDEEKIKTTFEACRGEESCQITFVDVYPEIATIVPGIPDGVCKDLTSQFFIQYECHQDAIEQEKKYNIIARAAGCVMFVAFSYMLFIWYIQKSQGLDRLENDMNTVTASDFTVELDISKAMWTKFQEDYYEPKLATGNLKEVDGSEMSQALYLKKHLTKEIGRILSDARENRQDAWNKSTELPAEKPEEGVGAALLKNFNLTAPPKKKTNRKKVKNVNKV